jgi:hypothetical protein
MADEERDEGLPGLGPLDSRPGPSRPISAARSEEMVGEALARAGRRHVFGRKRLFLVAAAISLVALAAGATVLLVVTRDDSDVSSPQSEAFVPASSGSPAAPVVVPPSVESSPGPSAVTSPVPLAIVEREVLVVAPAPPAPFVPPSSAVVEPPSSVAPVAAVRPAPDPVDALAEANRLRAARRWADAERAYVLVMRAAPESNEAYVATVAAAALRLERLGEPAAAEELFRKALELRPRGTLAEEAAYGLADCRRARGDSAGEAQALRAFLAGHPDALAAPQAAERLRALETTAAP